MYCPKPVRFNRLSVHSPKGKYSPSDDNDCSTRISQSGDQDCSTGISGNPVSTQLSLVGNEQFFWEVGDRIHHRKDPNRTGTVLKPVKGSTRFFIAWDAGSRSAVEGRNLSLIPVEQRDYRNSGIELTASS